MIDSNVLVSGVIFRLSLPRQAVDFAFENDSVLSSSATRNELREVFRRAKFDRYCPLDQRLEYLEDIIEEMTPVSITEIVRGSRDAKDDKFLELAVNGRADLIVSGDMDLLQLNPFRGIHIVTPAEYLAS